jgi:pimeloyl-ACP methyl ester carboxylesterase
MARGHVILSHGLESGPEATKVSALARVAEALGWTHERPDYRDLDAGRRPEDLSARVARLRGRAEAVQGPLVLAGSSMGAFISGEVAWRLAEPEKPGTIDGVACGGPTPDGPRVLALFLMAPPIAMPGWWATPLRAPAHLPTMVVHGWDDELIPAQAVIDWCVPRKAELRLVDDAHRLAAHVEYSARAFGELLQKVAA